YRRLPLFQCRRARNRAKIYKLKNRVCKDFGKWRCIGSSHGWLILLDHERSCPFLLNPFSSTRILLPPPETIADIVGYLDGEGYYVLDCSNSKRFISIEVLRDGFFHKATPSSHPYLRKKYGAIVIYNNKSKLAFWKHGEVTWHNFNGASQSGYTDVTCTADNRIMHYQHSPTIIPKRELNGTLTMTQMEGTFVRFGCSAGGSSVVDRSSAGIGDEFCYCLQRWMVMGMSRERNA
ncbi:hypothetical protein CISIN_1g048529mg, partial [Citrus sinensis]